MKRNLLTILAATSLLSLSQGALSAETPATTTMKAGDLGLFDRVSVGYFGIYHGNSLTDPSSPYGLDRNGKVSTKLNINLDGTLSAAYNLDSQLSMGPEVPFILVPVLGKGAIMGDVGFNVSHKNTINAQGFKLSNSLGLQLPTSQSSQDRKMSMAIKLDPSMRYEFAKTGFSLGNFSELKTYLGVTRDKSFKIWTLPYASYQLTQSVSLNLAYEMEWQHFVNTPNTQFSTYQMDLQPGLNVNITKNLFFNPYLQIFTTQSDVNTDKMALGAVISAKLL